LQQNRFSHFPGGIVGPVPLLSGEGRHEGSSDGYIASLISAANHGSNLVCSRDQLVSLRRRETLATLRRYLVDESSKLAAYSIRLPAAELALYVLQLRSEAISEGI
jgi:hypothetical protein